MIANELKLMDSKYNLDTNIVIALFAGDESILFKLTQVYEVFISSIVLGELNYGALKSARVDKWTKKNKTLKLKTAGAQSFQ